MITTYQVIQRGKAMQETDFTPTPEEFNKVHKFSRIEEITQNLNEYSIDKDDILFECDNFIDQRFRHRTYPA